jgi:hypothetical protein
MGSAVAFTIVDDAYFYPVGAHIFINSFKKFHPDIPLVVFRQDEIDRVFDKEKINFYQAKPTFARLLAGRYKLVVNIDADTIILDRLTRVFDEDYDVGGVWNYNDYENASFDSISEEMYVQAGMVASRRPEFWGIWEEANKKAMDYLRKENDTLNLVWYQDSLVSKMHRLIWDKDKDYYGCKSLGREVQFYIENGKTMLKGEQVKAYHFARGNVFPKLDIPNMPIVEDVKENWKKIAHYGKTVTVL